MIYQSRYRQFAVAMFAFFNAFVGAAHCSADQRLRLTVVDQHNNAPLPARVYLEDQAGRAYFLTVPGNEQGAVPYDKQNWINSASIERHTTIVEYPAEVRLEAGTYRLTVERGKTYLPVTQDVTIADKDIDLVVPLVNWFNATAHGLYSGDTHIHRPMRELRNIVLAEDLNVTFPFSFWVTRSDLTPADGDRNVDQAISPEAIAVDAEHIIWPRNTEYEIFTTSDKTHTLGALFALGHKQVLDKRVPPWRPFVESLSATEPQVMYDMDKLDWPFAMVLPTIVPGALYELANNHHWRTEFAFRKWNSPAPSYMIPPTGASEGGLRPWIDYTLGMYYSLLNTGLRIAPTAGTANGVHPVPAGFGRAYVHLPNGFSYDAWCEGLRKGQSFITTGPMIVATADGQDPGHVFVQQTNSGQVAEESSSSRAIELKIELFSETPITFGELIINGIPEQVLRPSNQRNDIGVYRSEFIVSVQPNRSGWFAVRFFEDREPGQTRFVHTAPWYVEVDALPVQIRQEEKLYLIGRMKTEMERSRGVVPEEGMEEYLAALRFYEALPVLDDRPVVARNGRSFNASTSAGGLNRQEWLRNMIVDHRMNADEIRMATGASREEALGWIQTYANESPDRTSVLKVLPYPGGRHPRRGFLEGAVDPQRESKVSIFAPWDNGGYVVVDVPEAIFSNLGLTYLAHTHIPTIWDTQGKELSKLEWQKTDFGLRTERALPNGIVFRSQVTPQTDSVAMEMELTNGTDAPLTGLRAQVCVMLAGATGFSDQIARTHLIDDSFVAVAGDDPHRWIITSWQPIQRAWTNPPVPCIHADPIFPDCAPNQTVRVAGKLWFYEGDNVKQRIAELKKEVESPREVSARRNETVAEMRTRLSTIVTQIESQESGGAVREAIQKAETRQETRQALRPMLLASVQINPESRVKISAELSRIEVRKGVPQRFFLHIENLAGTTAPLKLRYEDITLEASQEVDWLEIRLIDDPWVSPILSGAEEEYKVVEVVAKHDDLREIRIFAEAGQGTQDLGFRAMADILIDSQP